MKEKLLEKLDSAKTKLIEIQSGLPIGDQGVLATMIISINNSATILEHTYNMQNTEERIETEQNIKEILNNAELLSSEIKSKLETAQ